MLKYVDKSDKYRKKNKLIFKSQFIKKGKGK